MVVDPVVIAGVSAPCVGVIVWVIRLDTRVRILETDMREAQAYQRIVMRGLVRMGVVRQDEVDAADEHLGEIKR